jgi:cell division protein FtsN
MGENNLDDLILTEPESEGGSNRGLLVILGLVVLLLILGVVLANIIFGSGSDDNNTTTEGIKSESAQVVDTNSSSNSNMNMAMSMDNNVAAATQSGDKKDDLDADLAPLDDKDNIASSNTTNIKDDEPKVETKEIATAAATATATAASTAKKAEPKKAEPKKSIKPKRVEHKIKHIVKKRTPKKETRASSASGVSYGGNIYIQVGSFSKGPSADFINKIRSAGFKYRIKEANGFRRVLVGPFKSASDAQRVLGSVKSKISPSAFIKR